MTITTKFNINDEVWFIYPRTQKVICGRVGSMSIKVHSRKLYEPDDKKGLIATGEYKETSQEVVYQLFNESTGDVFRKETELFPTKQELINSL